MTTIKLDPGAALLLDALHGAGHAAYAVGGCVQPQQAVPDTAPHRAGPEPLPDQCVPQGGYA